MKDGQRNAITDTQATQQLLLDTIAAIEQTKKAIAGSPGRKSLLVSLKSLEKRQRQLEQRFLAEAEKTRLDLFVFNGREQG